MEWFGNFLISLPPFLQLVLGALAAVGVLVAAIRIGDWFDAREKKKK